MLKMTGDRSLMASNNACRSITSNANGENVWRSRGVVEIMRDCERVMRSTMCHNHHITCSQFFRCNLGNAFGFGTENVKEVSYY
jgi:hypothetical protein